MLYNYKYVLIRLIYSNHWTKAYIYRYIRRDRQRGREERRDGGMEGGREKEREDRVSKRNVKLFLYKQIKLCLRIQLSCRVLVKYVQGLIPGMIKIQ